MIHSKADVQSSNIGENTVIWQFAIVLPDAIIGKNCNINCHTFIENKVKIGNNVTVKSGVYIWDGITIEDNVFIGPNVTFINDKYPKSKRHLSEFAQTQILSGSSIGAGSIIHSGITIGKNVMVGAGANVTKSVPDFALVIGNPASIVGYVDEEGTKMIQVSSDEWKSVSGKIYKLINNNLELQ